MKKFIFISLFVLFIIGCSSPKAIILTDGSVIRTKDEPEFKRKTNLYEYVDQNGKKGTVNAQSVKVIQPIDAEIPKVEVKEPAPITPIQVIQPATTDEPVVVDPVAE